MKKRILALLLVMALTVPTAFAAWAPADFEGGSLSGIVADGESVLVSDVFNKVVWKVTADGGVEQTVGQISVPSLSGEPIGKYADGTLDTALFLEPWAMAPFLEGYAVTDTAAHVVRYFDEKGVFTAGGTGERGYRNGTGTGAAFDTPTGLAADEDGKLYIADTGNGAIRVMDEKGKVTTLVTGLTDPTGLCWADGALYVAETGRNRICRIVNGRVEVIAGGGEADGDEYPGAWVDGPVAKARFDHPQGVAVDDDGVIYVADTGNGAIRKIADGRVTTLESAEDSPKAPVKPRSILIREDSLLVTDLFTGTLAEVDLTPVSYTDFPADSEYAGAIYAATERGITNGTGNDTFSPDVIVTRAMAVTMLSRLHLNADGHAVIGGEQSFTDVPEGSWFEDAVRWAADLDIVGGYGGGMYGAEDPVTWEQLVTILYRYAGMMGYDVSVGEDTNILSYTDAFDISEYAIPAMQWACGAGLIGDGESLCPQDGVTRAQAAALLVAAMDLWDL